jgi:glycosyltransferase involved in cell wall biosynthesis
MYLIISAVFPPEPVVSAILSKDIAEYLSKDEQVTVLFPKPSRPFGFKFKTIDSNYEFKTVMLNSYICPQFNFFGRLRESFSMGIKCRNYIENNYFQIKTIYINVWPLFAQYYIVRTAKKYKIPCIVHVQDIYPESLIDKLPNLRTILSKCLLPIDKYILSNATKIVAISGNMKIHLIKTRLLDSNKIEIVHNWQNENDFITHTQNISCQNNIQKGKFIFMYLGNIGPVAGVEFLIDSFIRANLKNVQLIIAGNGSHRTICEHLAGNNSDIVFLTVPDGYVSNIQCQANVLLLPVKKNGAKSSIPSKLPAYMFSSKPIIACVDNNSDTAICIQDAKAGIVSEPENVNSLIEAMQKMQKTDEQELLNMGKNGFNYALSHFSREINLKKLIGLLKMVKYEN